MAEVLLLYDLNFPSTHFSKTSLVNSLLFFLEKAGNFEK